VATIKQGRASSVTDLGDGTVLRTGGRPQAEARMMELARSHGFPVPRVHEVRSDGLVLERIDGPTMGDEIRRRPWRGGRNVRALAELHERLHRIPFDGATLVHFDLHPDNVLMSPSGPVVIDWTNAHGGDPKSEVAMTWLILATSAGLPGRVLAALFKRQVGHQVVARGLDGASAFRLDDPHVSDTERSRVRRLSP
jgi:serine/threonine protein kinase